MHLRLWPLLVLLSAAAAPLLAEQPDTKHCLTIVISDFPGESAEWTYNHIEIEIANNSFPAIEEFKMTIATGFFDGPIPLKDERSRTRAPEGGSFTLHEPDFDHGGGTRSKTIHWEFEGFDSGESFRFDVDLDKGSSDTYADARRMLFNNGAAANATVFARFADGSVIEATLPDAELLPVYVYAFPVQSCLPFAKEP